MPELPEVETIVQGLRRRLLGRRFTGVQVFWPGALHQVSPEFFRQQVAGRQVLDVARRAKFLVLTLSDGLYMLIHLRMTGQLLLCPALPEERKHIHVAFALDDGTWLYFRDVRKFGRIYWVDDCVEVLGCLGPEPLSDDLSLEAFRARLGSRQGMIKPLLLDQRFLAGLGNIYADEALFQAGLDPRRRVEALDEDEVGRLYEAIRAVLRQGIANGGTTLDDYRDAEGQTGRNQESLAVFRRAEEPCPRCGTIIQRLVVGGRGTFICSNCQR